jgi:hypothetical protein
MKADANTLAKVLQPVHLSQYSTVAEQVFGAQNQQSKLSLEHIVNLLTERAQLHKRHLDDIQRRHLDVHSQLFGAKLHSKLDNHKRAMTLQTTILKLDEQRRNEELAFWKDTAELRNQFFEAAGEYSASRHRVSLLEDIESGVDVYG